MSVIRGAIFDLDDTLVKNWRPFSVISDAVKDEMRRLGVDEDHIAGMQSVLEGINALPERLKSPLMERLAELEAERAASALVPVDTFLCLDALHEMGITCGVATRNCRSVSIMLLEPILPYFSAIVTRDDVEHVKPDPEHLVRTAAAMGLRPSECVAIGDFRFDIQAARAAGCVAVGLRIEGDYTVSSLAEIPSLIGRLNGESGP